MFGVGWTEMLVIGVVALIVIGPKDLPMLMGRLGKAVATIRRLGGEFQREINKTTGLDQITDLRRSLTEPLKKTADEITREFNRTLPSGAVVPSGSIAPKTADAESVVAEIHEKVGMSAVAPGPVAAPVVVTPPNANPPAPKHVESPAPVEAIAPAAAARPRKPRAKKPEVEPAASAAVVDTVAAPRKPRAPRKPKAEA